MSNARRIAADIGGTFTDIAHISADGRITTRKVASTPPDYAQGVIDGTDALRQLLDLPAKEIGDVLHGSTIATNAILEKRGARTALVTTRGFRDVLELRRIRVPKLYDPLYVKPDPLVPRHLRFELTERIDPEGSVVTRLDDIEVEELITRLEKEDVEAIAVCFLHSYANPAHEEHVGEKLRERFPDAFISLSVNVLPEVREYERTSTTVINSYVGPAVRRYLTDLENRLQATGIEGSLRVIQSGGGILDATTVCVSPARIVECGPAAGVVGAARMGKLCGYENIITFDMGGTTAKASMIEAGRIATTDEYEVGGGLSASNPLVSGVGYALKLPVIDIAEIGAGGGSIVWIDKAGSLKIGPHSAGASPGPACYGSGGTDPTITDANVVLGFLNPHALAGGSVPIQGELSSEAVHDFVAGPLEKDLHEAAWGIHILANANMMRAIKAVSTYRGRDPRDFALFAFGGNGGVHGVELARTLSMREIIIPPAAGIFSALGLLLANPEASHSKAYPVTINLADPGRMSAILEELERKARSDLGIVKEGSSALVGRFVTARYRGQAFELPVEVTQYPITKAGLGEIAEAFEAEHKRTYGHRHGDEAVVEIVTLKVSVTIPDTDMGTTDFNTVRIGDASSSGQHRDRKVYFGPDRGFASVPVIQRTALSESPQQGPVIVEDYDCTTVIPPDANARVDANSSIVITLQ